MATACRTANEPGLPGITVYVDTNGDNQFGVSEPAAISAANGSFVIGNVPRGTFAVRALVQPGWVQTAPAANGEYVVDFAKQLQAATSTSASAKAAAEKWASISATLPGRSRPYCPAMAHRTASCRVSNSVN